MSKNRGWALRPTKGEPTLVDLYHVESGRTLNDFNHPYMATHALIIANQLGDNSGLPLTDPSWKEWYNKYQRRIHALAQVVPCPTPGCPGKKAGRICRRPSGHAVTRRGGLQDVHGKRFEKFDIWLEKQLPKKHHRKGKRDPCPVDMHKWLREGIIESGAAPKEAVAKKKRKPSPPPKKKRKPSLYNLHMKEKMEEGYSFEEAVGLWKLKKALGNPRRKNMTTRKTSWKRNKRSAIKKLREVGKKRNETLYLVWVANEPKPIYDIATEEDMATFYHFMDEQDIIAVWDGDLHVFNPRLRRKTRGRGMPTMGYTSVYKILPDAPKRYQDFVREKRLKGYTFKEIGRMWQKAKRQRR